MYLNYSSLSPNDESVSKLSFRLAVQYVNKYENSKDREILDKVNCIRYLLFSFEINPDQYIVGDEIIENLELIKGTEITKQYFRSEIIAGLRDEGVLIATSSNGYKLPTSERDCFDYINLGSNIIFPILKRLGKFTNKIKLATQKDLLDKPEYKFLKRILETENDDRNSLNINKVN
jgi:hypothetical protein